MAADCDGEDWKKSRFAALPRRPSFSYYVDETDFSLSVYAT